MQSQTDTVSQFVPDKGSVMSGMTKVSPDLKVHGHMGWHGWELMMNLHAPDSSYVIPGGSGIQDLKDMTNQTVHFG